MAVASVYVLYNGRTRCVVVAEYGWMYACCQCAVCGGGYCVCGYGRVVRVRGCLVCAVMCVCSVFVWRGVGFVSLRGEKGVGVRSSNVGA